MLKGGDRSEPIGASTRTSAAARMIIRRLRCLCVFRHRRRLNIDEGPSHSPFPWLPGQGGTAAWQALEKEQRCVCLNKKSKKKKRKTEVESIAALSKHAHPAKSITADYISPSRTHKSL